MPLKLSKREKYYIYVAVAFICIFVLFQLAVFPVFDKRERFKQMIQVKTQTLQDMYALKSEYETAVQKTNISKSLIEKRRKDFTLFSFLDKLAGESGLKNKIIYMKPTTSARKNDDYKISKVEMQLQGITLEQLTLFIYRIETSENIVSIRRLSISRSDKPEGTVTVNLQAMTIEI
jgi:general secretion pathway protein M